MGRAWPAAFELASSLTNRDRPGDLDEATELLRSLSSAQLVDPGTRAQTQLLRAEIMVRRGELDLADDTLRALSPEGLRHEFHVAYKFLRALVGLRLAQTGAQTTSARAAASILAEDLEPVAYQPWLDTFGLSRGERAIFGLAQL